MSTPARPGPAAYALVGAVISAAPIPVVIRIVTIVSDIDMPTLASIGLTATAFVLFVSAGALLAWLIVRYFRAEISLLRQRMEELEERSWWGKPRGDPSAEDTVDLSNVHVLPQRKNPPEKRSS